MTKFLTKAALAATVATGLFATPAAANPETFTATARIVSPLTLTLDNGGLDFGTITKLTALTSGDVSVGRAGGANACNVNLVCTTPTAAQFTVTGSADQFLTFTIVAPATLDSATDSVNFSVDAPAANEVQLSGLGSASFDIGGTITVLSTTEDGTYTGDVVVTAEYS